MQQEKDSNGFGYQPLQGVKRNAFSQASNHDYFDSSADSDSFFKRISGGIMANLRNSSILSGAGVVAAVAVFGFALYSFYPSSTEEGGAVPLIQAEAVPIKMEPAQDGGMEIPFRDSTVFGSAREASNTQGGIENLLDTASNESAEAPVNKEELIAQSQTEATEATEAINITEKPAVSSQNAALGINEEAEKMAALEAPVAANPAEPVEELDAPAPIAEVPAAVAEAPAVIAEAPKVVEPDAVPSETPMHEPAASPETLAFVRSVLDKKDAEKGYSAAGTAPSVATAEPVKTVEVAPAAKAANGIEPASGTEGTINAGAKTHYVQLASIPDRAKADAEWAKMKADFGALPGSSAYRVEEANLGERGTYYRIQAGPYSEDQAKSICDSIKTQKPGGCLVVR